MKPRQLHSIMDAVSFINELYDHFSELVGDECSCMYNKHLDELCSCLLYIKDFLNNGGVEDGR